MRKAICGLLVAATTILATLTTFTSCDLETSSAAGDFNGLWHLIRIDTLATGGVLDLKNEKRFWAFQNKLMQGDDKSGNHDIILMRFNQTKTMLTLHTPYLYDQNNGDFPLSESTLLKPYGINNIEEVFQVIKLRGNNMVLQSETLKLTFKGC